MDAWSLTSVKLLKLSLEIALAVCAIGLGLYALFSPPAPPGFHGEGAKVSVAVEVGAPIAQPPLALQAGGSTDAHRSILRAELSREKGTLSVRTESWVLYLLSKTDLLLGIPIGLWIFWNLHSFLRAVLAGTPFHAANSRRLRDVGLLLLGLPLVVQLAETSLAWTILGQVAGDGLSYGEALVQVPYEGFFPGLVLLAFASIFRYGTRIEEERSLTV